MNTAEFPAVPAAVADAEIERMIRAYEHHRSTPWPPPHRTATPWQRLRAWHRCRAALPVSPAGRAAVAALAAALALVLLALLAIGPA
jgi:hypothetical protein